MYRLLGVGRCTLYRAGVRPSQVERLDKLIGPARQQDLPAAGGPTPNTLLMRLARSESDRLSPDDVLLVSCAAGAKPGRETSTVRRDVCRQFQQRP